MAQDRRLVVFITTPLEEEYAAQIQAVAPEQIEVIYDPEIFPPMRYVADHYGPPGFRLSPELQERYLAHLKRADILWDFPSLLPEGVTFTDAAPNVKWVQTTSSGVGQAVARMGLTESDLLVTTASGVHAEPLAEFVFLTFLMHVKQLAMLQERQRAHQWERFCSDSLSGKTLAIVGPGRIGQQVAKVARAFNMRVIGLGRTAGPERAAELGFDALYTRDQLHEMLGKADAVVLCMPHTPETENMIDRAAFEAMKDGVLFVNIARGSVVDEDALIDALRSGKIAFAGLDVFRVEPLPADSPIWDMPNVLVNSHSASTAYTENAKITEIFTHNLRCYLDGRLDEMRNVLDKRRMY